MSGHTTDFGFVWGPMEVSRLCHIEGRGYVLEIKTKTRVQQIYVTEAGRVIKAYEPRKRESGLGALDS